MADPYDAGLLDAELRDAGLKISGCSSKGRIDWNRPPTDKENQKAKDVLAKHDPKKLLPQYARLEELREKRRNGKKLTAKEQEEVLDFFLEI